MNVRNEIKKYAAKEDIVILEWLFDRYHFESQWHFVACCRHERYGIHSYQTHRVWIPTREGRAIYAQLSINNKEH